jgi:hypothetical protein
MLWKYTHDKAYKKRIRDEIAQALGIDVEENVKPQLTAYANGSKKDINLHAYYKTFQEESDKLRKNVLKYISISEPKVLMRAKEQSRKWKALQKEIDWSDTESMETRPEALGKSSVFFFVWTWYERQIRQAMLDVLNDGEVRVDEGGIEVHDAVYSKRDIDEKILEQAIYSNTGFSIIIEKEKPSSRLN